MTADTAPALAQDLVAGLRRLKLATVRAIAPEVLVASKTQRWSPEDLLGTLVEAEIAARDDSNARARPFVGHTGGDFTLAIDRRPGAVLQKIREPP